MRRSIERLIKEVIMFLMSFAISYAAYRISVDLKNFDKIDWSLLVLTAPLVYILLAQMFRVRQLSELQHRLDTIITEQSQQNRTLSAKFDAVQVFLDKGLKYEASVVLLTIKLTKLNSFDRVMHSTGYFAMQTAISGFWFSQKRKLIEVKGRELSTRSYLHFWGQLIGEKYQLPTDAPRPIARITHSSEIDHYYDGQTTELNRLHEQFRTWGTVFRVLIDRQDRKSGVRHYTRIMKAMQSVGVNCVYINLHHCIDFPKGCQDRDFCLVGTFEYYAEWELDEKERVRIFRLTSLHESYQEKMDTWNHLLDNIRDYQYQHIADDGDRSYLEDSRKKFFAANP